MARQLCTKKNPAIDGKAPTSHASTATTYGVGSTSNYGHVKVDNAMSSTSTNPVQNKIINTALGNKLDASKIKTVDKTITTDSHGVSNLNLSISQYYVISCGSSNASSVVVVIPFLSGTNWYVAVEDWAAPARVANITVTIKVLYYVI